ncbi:MAG: hypothetical protein ACFBSD_10055 [Paracoccaceae bacterium]
MRRSGNPPRFLGETDMDLIYYLAPTVAMTVYGMLMASLFV